MIVIPATAPALKEIFNALSKDDEAAAVLILALIDIHILIKPETVEQKAPKINDNEVTNPKLCLPIKKYIKYITTVNTKAKIPIVEYCLFIKALEPSFIAFETSCISFVPVSFFKTKYAKYIAARIDITDKINI